jgi:hypothetical protein
MNRLAVVFAPAFAVCLINSPALSRAAPHSGITTCEGKVGKTELSNPGWYEIDVCSFDGNTPSGKTILNICGIGNPCRIKAFGEWAPGFNVKRIISAQRIDEKALNEMPKEYQGTWTLYRGQREASRPNSTEDRMPVGTKGIGWLNGLCNVTAVNNNESLTSVVKETCAARGDVTELWTLRELNGLEMLIVATVSESSPGFTPYISIYVHDVKSKPE